MADKHVSQAFADALLAVEKQRVDEKVWEYPAHGTSVQIPLQSTDLKEEFVLDVKRYRIDLVRRTFQNRGRVSLILARVDLRGPSHDNPDGTEVPPPHIHLYREGYGDKWAFPLPDVFSNPEDTERTLLDFMGYCNITLPPRMQQGWV
ncbi:MAG TPA: hypothetical protein V6D00_09025 [Pantanalinema sp.]